MLSDAKVRRAKEPGKYADGLGLTLLVKPNGSKLWRFRYRFRGKERMIGLGRYPDVSLSRAREKRTEVRELLDRGIDPAAQRKLERVQQADTFQAIAEEWLENKKTGFAEQTLTAAEARLRKWVFPQLGSWPIRDIEPPDVLRVLRRIESLGKHETAHRVKNRISQVCRYAVATGRATRDPTADLKGALAPVPNGNHAAITEPAKVGELLRAIDGYQGQPSVMYALRLLPYVFVRPGEFSAAEWQEFDLDSDEPEWRIPAEKTKMRRMHIVPLATQAVEILEELRAITGSGRYLFPSIRTAERRMSGNTLAAALRRLGYSGKEQTVHGFRSIASTLLHEMGVNELWIEAQLAHVERSKVKRAYNHAKYLPQRRKMMQQWADYLDQLRADDGRKVVPIGKKRA